MQAALVLFLASICLVASRQFNRDQHIGEGATLADIQKFIKNSLAIAGSLDPITKYTADGKVPVEVLREDVIDSLFDGEYPGPTSMKFKEIWKSSVSNEEKKKLLNELFKRDEALLRRIGAYMAFLF